MARLHRPPVLRRHVLEREVIRIRLVSLALLLSAVRSEAQIRASALATSLPDSIGVLIVAHGANDGWNARVDTLAAAVRRGGRVRGPVGVSFLMGPAAATRRFQDEVAALGRAGAKRVVVVPMLVSSVSGHADQIRYLVGALDSLDADMTHHLHMSGIARPVGGPRLSMAPALDDAPELADVLATRAKALVPDTRGRALLLLGHGPNVSEEYAAWMRALRPVADSIKARAGFASVVVELVRDDAPAEVRAEAVLRSRELIALQRAATGQDVVVVPILVSSGSLNRTTVPADLAGLPIVYSGDPLLFDPAIARWVERRVMEAVRR
jgi:sirohydrochlorin cobaltochelatase